MESDAAVWSMVEWGQQKKTFPLTKYFHFFTSILALGRAHWWMPSWCWHVINGRVGAAESCFWHKILALLNTFWLLAQHRMDAKLMLQRCHVINGQVGAAEFFVVTKLWHFWTLFEHILAQYNSCWSTTWWMPSRCCHVINGRVGAAGGKKGHQATRGHREDHLELNRKKKV